MKRTPLYEKHCKLGGKMIDFGGWELPVQYATGIIQEHEKVRIAAGLFDVSHMGEVIVEGSESTQFIQKLVTNDISTAKDGQIVYSPMCYPDGGVVDDLIVYKFNNEKYFLVVNASNTDKDFQWMQDNLEGDVKITNMSERYAQLAIQGPKAEQILQRLNSMPLSQIKFFHFMPELDLNGIKALVSRSGYTGEDGFEIYITPEHAPCMWEMLLEAGRDEGLVPVGLGARDTLRFEAALPLYGQEISQDISPLEAGLNRFVKLDKEYFIGKEALVKQKQQGIPRKLVGFEMVDRGVPRSHYEVEIDGRIIGFVTTGSYSPTLKKNIGLALVDAQSCELGSEFNVVIRNKPLKAKVIKTPFYAKQYKK